MQYMYISLKNYFLKQFLKREIKFKLKSKKKIIEKITSFFLKHFTNLLITYTT